MATMMTEPAAGPDDGCGCDGRCEIGPGAEAACGGQTGRRAGTSVGVAALATLACAACCALPLAWPALLAAAAGVALWRLRRQWRQRRQWRIFRRG